MIELAPGWGLEIDRGPDWLIIQVKGEPQQPPIDLPLAETTWALMQKHFLQRVIIELHEAPFLYSQVIGELVLLHKRVSSNGGLLRLCGLSEPAAESLRVTRLDHILPCFVDRGAAVMGHRPRQPR